MQMNANIFFMALISYVLNKTQEHVTVERRSYTTEFLTAFLSCMCRIKHLAVIRPETRHHGYEQIWVK